MARLEGDRSTAQRAGVSYRGATSRVPDTFTEDIQAGAAVPGTTDNDLESWRQYLAERVPLDIHNHITTQIASPNGDDRFAASAEVAAGDPTRWISLRQIGQWIKANFAFHLKSDVTRQAPGINEDDRLVMSDESAAGDPNSWITMAALLNWLRSRVAFDIHDDLATEITNISDDDRLPISDESVNGDPNRYVEASDLAAYVIALAPGLPQSILDQIQQNHRLLSDMIHIAGDITWANARDSGRDGTVATNLGGLHFSSSELNSAQVRALADNRWAPVLNLTRSNRGYLYIRTRHNRSDRNARTIIDHYDRNPDLPQLVSGRLNLGNSTDAAQTWRYHGFYDSQARAQRQIVDGTIQSVTLQFATVTNQDATEYRGKFGGTFDDGVLLQQVDNEAAWRALPNKTNKLYYEAV